jgi:ABC-type bacteriocin/lantibiotic exporter with double-glycine peptidase domain
MINKVLNKIKNNFWKVFIQIIINTFFLFFILLYQNSKLMFVIFGISVIIEIFGMLILIYFACVKGSLVNVTNNKFIVIPEQDIDELKKNNK